METGSPADGEVAPLGTDRTATEYLWKLDEGLRYWYSAAETKAQVVVTLNGIFLAFLTGLVLANRDTAAKTVAVFGPETWTFFAGMTAGVAGAIFCAVACLVPRGVGRKQAGQGPDLQTGRYKPAQTVFFADLATLETRSFLAADAVDKAQFVVEALARDHIEWSKYILKKHRTAGSTERSSLPLSRSGSPLGRCQLLDPTDPKSSL